MYLLTALYFLPHLIRNPAPTPDRVLQNEIMPQAEPQQGRQVLHGHRRDNPLFRPLCIPVNSQVRSPRIPFSPSALFLFPDQIHNNRNYRHSRKASDRNPQTDVALISGLWCRADLEGPFHRAQVINARVKDNRMISGSQ